MPIDFIPFFKMSLFGVQIIYATVKMAVSIEDESNNPCMKQMSDASNQTSATPNYPCGSIADASAETEESAAGISFNPPLYLQRYKLVIDFVEKTNARKVLSFPICYFLQAIAKPEHPSSNACM